MGNDNFHSQIHSSPVISNLFGWLEKNAAAQTLL